MEGRMIFMFVMVMVMISKETTGFSMNMNISVSSTAVHQKLAHKGVCQEVERKALIKFYDEILNKKDIQTFLQVSKGMENCCVWDGVTCDAHGSIVSLNFGNYSSPIDATHAYPSWPIPLGELQSLQALEMEWVDFGVRPLPPALGLLPPSLLTLAIRGCYWVDPVPWAALANLSRLTYLDLNWLSSDGVRQLSDSVHQDQWGTIYYNPDSYVELDLSHNLLSGSIPPTFLSGCNLDSIDLSSNYLSGQIPSSFCQGNSGLNSIDLSSNLLSGQIPSSFCVGNPELTILRLAANNLNGSIPHELGHCTQLLSLVLHNNHLTGFIPAGIYSNLSSTLQILDLSHNHLEGSIPMSLQQMYALQVLCLDYNNLSGQLPSSPWNTSQLQVLGLSHNNLSGIISAESLSLLHGFRYNSTYYKSGTQDELPYHESIELKARGQDLEFTYILKATVSLDLSYNDLYGPIPAQLSSLTSLVFLTLSHNHLNGTIPQSLQNLTQLLSLDLSNNNLEGEIPSDLCQLTFLEFVNVSNNELEGRILGCPQWCTFNGSSFLGNKDLFTNEQCASPAGDNSSAPINIEQKAAADQQYEDMNELLLGVVVGVCISFPLSLVLIMFWRPVSEPIRFISQQILAKLCG